MKSKKVKLSKNGKKGGEVGELKIQLARALADYDNLRKRVEREQEHFTKFANVSLIERFLGIYDMLVSAQEHLNDSGLAIALEEFKNSLRDEGVEEIKVEKGDDFNEELFDAVEAIEGKRSKIGKVAEIILTGWRYIEGPVIRPAKVKVYKQ